MLRNNNLVSNRQIIKRVKQETIFEGQSHLQVKKNYVKQKANQIF